MMGHKDKLKTAMEFDVIFARKIYCYLHNNYKLVSYCKNKINRRNRYKSKLELKVHQVFTKLNQEEESIFDFEDKQGCYDY